MCMSIIHNPFILHIVCDYILHCSLSPKVLWSQNHSVVTLSVQLRGCVNYHTEFHENSVKFWYV